MYLLKFAEILLSIREMQVCKYLPINVFRLKRLSDSPLPSDGDSVEVAKATLRGDLVDVIRILERIQDNTKS